MNRNRTPSARVYYEYFYDRLATHGESFTALDYGSKASQTRRFEVVAEGLRRVGRALTILDVGCGFGDFLGHLRRSRFPVGRYVGYDLVPGMVSIARKRYPEGRFLVRDVLKEGIHGRFDYVVANGIFYIRAPDSERHLRRMVRLFWNHCRRGVIFSARSTLADPDFIRRESHFYQYDPVEVLRYCLGLTRLAALRHDFMPHDFIVYLYRDIKR